MITAEYLSEGSGPSEFKRGVDRSSIDRFAKRYILSHRLLSRFAVRWGRALSSHMERSGMPMIRLPSMRTSVLLDVRDVEERLGEMHEFMKSEEREKHRRRRSALGSDARNVLI